MASGSVPRERPAGPTISAGGCGDGLRRGAYGFVVTGLAGSTHTLGLATIPHASPWPALEVDWDQDTSQRPGCSTLDADRAVCLLLDDEYVELERRQSRVTIHASRPLDEHEIVHPYLASPAGIMAQWNGRLALHAGGIVLDGGVWALLGARGAGKTTMLMACADHGLEVLADDLVVIDGEVAFAGPRTLDLRPETALRATAGAQVFDVRRGQRSRLRLPPIAAELPFRGSIVLTSGSHLTMSRLPLRDRTAEVQRHLMMGHHDPRRLLDLIGRQMWTLSRPKNWLNLPDAVSKMVETVGSHSS